MNLLFLKKRKGQIRGIDFTISLVLFIILFSQLILVLFNARITIVNQIQVENNAEMIANRLFGFTGAPNWENTNDPTEIGLKSTHSSYSEIFNLDIAKIARLKRDVALINQENSSIIQSYVPYDVVKQNINLKNIDFKVSLQALVNLSLTHIEEVGGEGTIVGSIKTNRGLAVADVSTKLFGINVENDTVFYITERTSNISGAFTYTLPYYPFPYAIFAISDLYLSFTYDWVIPNIVGRDIIPIDASAVPTVVTSTNAVSGRFVSYGTEMDSPTDSQTILSLQPNSTNTALGGFTQTNLGVFSDKAISIDFSMASDSYSILFMIMKSTDDYFLKLDSSPMFLDGAKAPPIQEEATQGQIPSDTSIEEYRTLVTVHGILMEAIVNSWSV